MLKQQSKIGLVVWILLALGLSYLITGNINPLSVYKPGVSLIGKILMSVMLLYIVIMIFALLSLSVPGLSNMVCPICDKNLMSFVTVYGNPLTCPNCRNHGRLTMYHSKCFKAAGQCPVCAQQNPMNDLHSFP